MTESDKVLSELIQEIVDSEIPIITDIIKSRIERHELDNYNTKLVYANCLLNMMAAFLAKEDKRVFEQILRHLGNAYLHHAKADSSKKH